MTSISRIRVALTGFTGGPGVCTFFALDATALVDALHTYWGVAASNMPPTVHIQIVNSGDIIEDTTGDLVGGWSTTALTPQVGSGGPNYSAPTGIIQHWTTGTILDHHRVKGSTFIVPSTRDLFETDGTVAGANLAQMVTAGTALVTASAGNFVVWHRPRAAKAADGSRKAITQRDGGHAVVTGTTVPDRAVVLTSRRG